MYEGTVVKLALDRQFGFIETTGQPDVFFHVSELADDLEFDSTLQERRVRFDIVSTAKGARAANVRAAD